MKNNGLLKFTTFVLLVTMVATSLVSGTYAKYTTERTGTAVATVAKFSVEDNFSADGESFDLFATVAETDGSGTETDVAANRIAPGTGGKFKVTLTNNSEVTVVAKLTLEEVSNTSNIPIEYSYDGQNYFTALAFEKESTLAMSGATKSSDVVVYWRWAFDGASSTNYQSSQTDTSDSLLGEAATAPTVTVKAIATFTQAD